MLRDGDYLILETMPDCVVVAAGRSSRMKAWKPALPWKNGRSLLEQVVGEAESAGCRVILVGGFRYRRLRKLVGMNKKITFVRNQRWRRGMDVSVRCALPLVTSRRFFLVAGDMPLIRVADYHRLSKEPAGEVLRPVFDGVPGHPVLFDSSHIPELLKGADGVAIRTLLLQFNVRKIEWDDEGVVIDIDTPEAYRKYLDLQ